MPTITCNRCGGIISGPPVHTGHQPCNCIEEKKSNLAWICPVCGAGMSPYVTKCDCTKSYTLSNEPMYPMNDESLQGFKDK